MKNARNNGQKRVKNCLKWTASGLLLALMFVLVFAGTLSGAFGVEENLVQNGKIEGNVASAEGSAGSTSIDISSEFNATNTNSFNINPDVNKRGKLWTTDATICDNNTWTTGDGTTGGTWTIGNGNSHYGVDYGFVWFDFDIKDWYENFSDTVNITLTSSFSATDDEYAVVGIASSSSGFIEKPTDAEKLYKNIKNGIGESGNSSNDKTNELKGKNQPITLVHTLQGRYVRIYYLVGDYAPSAVWYYFRPTSLSNVKVSIERTLKSYTIEYNKNADSSTGTVESTPHKYMEASNVSSGVFSGKDQYFTNWNTRADGSGVAMGIGASTGTSTAANTFGGVVKSNLQNGQTTTTLYAQYKEIPFEFNGVTYNTYNPQATNLVVLKGKSNYMSSTIDGYDTSIEYKNADGVTVAQPDAKGNYTATITVKKGEIVHGTRTVEFEVVEGDFGKVQGGTGKWGSVTNPYVISNETHLKNLSAIVNGRNALNSIVGSDGVTADEVVATDKTYKDCNFVISADLGADTAIELVPIGKDSTHYFAGTIFGGNDSDANNRTMRTITLNIQQSGVSNVGLFGYVKGASASISHLTTAGSIAGDAAVGGLVGYADGVTISNCRNNATVSGAYMIGGLVGYGNNVTITSSVNNADITSEYNKAGTPSGLSKGAYVGGIVGVANGGSIAHCYNSGNISASGDNSDFLGGIAGYTTAPITYCASLKDKKIEGSNQVGGIVGKASGENAKIEYCYFGGTINGLWNDSRAKLDFICGEITGGTVSHSWKLSSAMQGATGNRKYNNAGKSIKASDFTLSPSHFDGTEYTTYTTDDGWHNILTVDINAFEILGKTENGKFLALHDGSNQSTLPNKTIIDKEKNSTGSPAKTDLVVQFIVYYNANTDMDVVAELKDIAIDAATVDYNATEQYVVDNTQLPTTVNTHYFKQSFYFDQNGGGNSTLGKTNAGTYKVYSDVWIRVNNTDYLVGRKESTWIIEKLQFIIDNNQFVYGQDIENAIQNQIVIKNKLNVPVPKEAYAVEFGFNDTDHNFYGSIDITQNQKEFIVAKTIITIYDSSRALITDNFVINGFSVIVKAGDFGVQNNGINKSNIKNNPWGSQHNPYIIGTNEQLTRLSNIVGGTSAFNSIKNGTYVYVQAQSGDYSGAYFKLADNIGGVGNITPIGVNTHPFKGNFDGNNKTIGGLSINKAGDYAGLFGYILNATIKDLTVNGSVKGSQYVGGLVGYASNSTIENVTNNVSVSSTTDKYVDYSIVRYHAHIPNAGEGVGNINDRNINTKYCTSSYGAMSFVIEVPTGTFLTGFTIQNATDTNSYSNRTPKEVYIWGSNVKPTLGNNTSESPYGKSPKDSGQQGWVSFYEKSDIGLPSTNSTKQAYEFNGKYNYKYYWIRVVGRNKQIQFAEFEVLTQGGMVGGVVGYASNSTIENVTNNASVEGGSNVGGIVGEFNSLGKSVSGATNSGAITSGNTAAGIVGKLTEGSISGSKNTGRVTASVATTIGGETGAFLGGIAGWANGNVNNCYNGGEITTVDSWGHSNIVGGIVGYLVNGKTVSYCYNSGTIVGSSQIGGIIGKLPGYRSTVTYCYHSGTINSVWNDENGVAQGALGHITGNYTEVLDSCWILPGASTNTAASTKIKTNGRKLEVGQYKYVPVTVENYEIHGWVEILTVNINGFRVQESVDPSQSQFFESKKGSNSSEFLTPVKTENDNQTNALNRDNTASFTATAWYGANTQSDISCAVKTINIDTSQDTYNGNQHGFTRSDVTIPGTSGSVYGVYGIVFDYKGKTHQEPFVCAFDASGTMIAGSANPTQVDVYDTTIFVKIGDTVVGKQTKVDYTIKKATLNVDWEWTDTLYSNLYDRTGNGDKVQFVYNGNAQGLGSVNLGNANLFSVTGNNLKNINAATYTRTYTLKDTRNYRLNFTNSNTGLTESTTSVEFKWTIRKNKLTVSNYWTGADLNPSGEFYTFEYNDTHQGLKLQDGITFSVEPDTRGNQHDIDTNAYEIAQGVECVAAYTYTRTFIIKDTTNYEVGNRLSYNTSVLPNQKGSKVNTEKSVVTYMWKIVPFDLAKNTGNVWFGGATNLVVGNQGIANVEVGTISYAEKRFYPLQSEQNGVQQVLVYSGHNYAHTNFVVYVKYNNGEVVMLEQGTEYTLSALNAPTVEKPAPLNTSVTASGTGNFSGNITKHYTAMYSDFGWKEGKTPEDNDWGGSADNPYVISTPVHLLRLSQIVNGGIAWNSIQNTVTEGLCIAPQDTAFATRKSYAGAYFLVTADIDMSGFVSTDGVYNFLPIGHRNEQSQTDMPFSGTFDGNGKGIKFEYNVNLNNFYNNIDAHSDYVGLFGYIAGYKVGAEQRYATIKNLSIESTGGNEVSDNGGIIGKDYVGGIAGYAVDSKLYNVSVMYGSWLRGENYVGGIVGYGENTWLEVGNEHDNAITYANVGGIQYVGGIVGKWIVRSEEQIGGGKDKQEYITTTLGTDVNGTQYVGGLVGWLDTSACTDSVVFAPIVKGSDQNKNVVKGTEYVGALFGVVVGNGYHQSATQGKYTAIVISDQKVNNITLQTNTNAKVVGGLVGYAESVGILFETDWNTSSTTFTLDDSTSFFGGVVGVLGKNSTIEAIIVTKEGDGSYLTGSEHTILNNTALGASGKPIGSFVGGIVGYVSSQAGTYWEANTTIFGNGISLVNSGQIHATGYAGGIFGALGDLSTSVAQTFENDTDSILYKVLTTGVRSGNANTTLGIAPTVASAYFTGAKGKLVNNASLSVTDGYVGGIAGYSGAKVRFVLRNKPQTGAIATENLNVYSGGNDIYINGSYAGGIAGYLVDNLEHELQYIVVQAKFDSANATRVGGLVGYMGSGKVENCVVTNGGNSNVNESTDTFKGSEYVGGLVGETQNAIITNSVSTGFNLDKTTNTKGGLLGGGTNPTIESSWTFYIAKSGATYSTVSKNTYGKYILVDSEIIVKNPSSYPPFADLCKFVGLVANADVDRLTFVVNVPSANDTDTLKNKQLAFYNASGNDVVTSNTDSFEDFVNNNNVLTIKLNMASGTSMQICAVKIEFVNVPQSTTSNDENARQLVEGQYKKPSNSPRYIVQVTTAEFDIVNTNQVTHIVANTYFQCNDKLVVVSNGAHIDLRRTGSYDSGELTPGNTAENPLTISNLEEWNDFAWNVYSGANVYKNKHIKLLTDEVVINTGTNGQHLTTKGSRSFGSAVVNNEAGAYATDNVGYNFAGSISNSNLGEKSFQGYFDGNGHSINIKYEGGNYHNVSVFPNANGATFKNLTITGSIIAGDKTTEWTKKWQNTFIGIGTYYAKMEYNAASDIAGFVGKPLGKIVFENCTNVAKIVGYSRIAGFAGYSTSTAPVELTGCVNKGDIESFEGSTWTITTGQDLGYPNDYPYGTGGLIAYAENAITIESCLNTGKIKGKTKVGGLVGRVLSGTTINNSANTGYIEADEFNLFVDSDKKKPANAWSRVGGIVGEASQSSTLKMYACYNTGHIRGWSNVAGGLVGMVGTIPNEEKTHSAVADNLCTIAYSYNTGKIEIGNVANQGITMVGTSGYNLNGTCGGGLVGVAVKLEIAYSYNTGDIIGYGGVGYSGSWQIRLGGILAEACTKQANCDVRVKNCYSTGRIYIEESHTTSDTRYGADIVGYLDEESTLNNNDIPKVNVEGCYGVANNIVSYKNKNINYFSGWNNQSGGNVKYVRTGTTLNSLSDLTAIMRSDGSVKPRAFYYANNQNNEVELWNASTATIKDGAQNTTAYQNGTLGGYVYVYGCLPQLAVFAVDTYNGLSMNSQNFGKDIYGEYKAQKAGDEFSPYVIRDGIDLMGVQTLVGLGYTFDGKYIEFANGSNNITLDKNLSSDVAKAINMPISNSTSSKIADSENAYQALGKDNTYHIGKSYHLFKLSAVCYDDNNIAQNTAYGYWLSSNHYYNGAYGEKEGAYKNYGTFKTQNILTIGRNGKVFKGSISGKQENNANTVINNLRITSGQTTGGAYGGLFGHVENAYIGYIEVGGESNIWAYSSDNQQIAATGAIAGYVTGDSVIEHCAVSGTTAIGAYGKNDDTHIASDITYAGGIVGLVNPKKGTQYEAGISAIIKDCTVNISTTTGDRAAFAGIIQACKSNIGGVLGYVGGDAGANGKGNSVRVEGCNVQKATIQAASSATESSHIGGVLGYGSEYVAAFITECSVGNGADTVTIKGEHSLGGIAGGMSLAKGGYIDFCIVGANTTIKRIDQGGDNSVAENSASGTAIGGLVGFTEDSTDTTSPLTTTFSGRSKFLGTINVTVGTTNPGEHGDKKPVGNVGGIVGDMGSGANFASGSDVTVDGTIDITLAAANVGGVAGRTSNATFIGKFNVRPKMTTPLAENVGGFIGKNVGTVYILADTTERIVDGELNGTNITIGGTIRGTSEVGGFIGVNNSGSSLNIGSNVANAKPYRSGTLSITIKNGTIIGGDNVGGIVGKNEGADGGVSYASIDIVKGTIIQQGTINGANNVGGIIGLNDGLLTTGGGEADTSIGGIALSDDQIGLIKNLSITNTGSVKGGTPQNAQSNDDGQCVGGVIGWLDAPQTLRTEHTGKGDIAGTFTNEGSVEGNRFVGGSIGYVGKYVNIATKGGVDTLFSNTGNVTAHGYFVGGSIGAIVGKITGANIATTVNFENTGKVNGSGYVGGSIGVLAGQTQFAQFVNSSGDLTIAACNSVGGSVGYIGMPDALKTILNTYFKDSTYSDGYVTVQNVHFEASGNLNANPSDDTVNAANNGVADNEWGGVGGAIGVLGKNQLKTWKDNTYYANGSVIAEKVNNVGGIVGLINAGNITISNMLAYRTTVTGGKNVGGIVGATNGENTKILSAYTIEGKFSGTENVGGIIGFANSTEGKATDAKTSYWVKGYSNAVLAGADVKELQQTLGKFETIVEQVTVNGKQQTIVFTEDFCKLYTPKTYYADYPGTHTYNGKTVTLGESAEQLTWDTYFKDNLGETSAQIKNGAWVKSVANAVTFTTGTETTGWYFAFANDANGANGLGTINTNHQGGGTDELKYWKRIANAYTAQERAEGEDNPAQDIAPPSNIVSGGQPQYATLYATATAAGEDSGYYLYMATSGASRPTATHASDKFFIQVLTTTTTRADLAQNVAIYYRTISKGKTLTYNGYMRYAPVGITVADGKPVPYVQTPSTNADKADSYCYSADTTTNGNATGGAQIDPGNYESAVKIYYYDKGGNPYVVGGVAIKWEIKARQLNSQITSDLNRVYGESRKQDGANATDKHDMKVLVSNIAPNKGTPPQFVITVKDTSSSPNVETTFTYTGNILNETKNGITVTAASIGVASKNDWDSNDNLYNVEEPTDKNTQEVLFYIDFTNAKTYEVTVEPDTDIWKKRYTLNATKEFSVNPAELTLKGDGTDTVQFDNKGHGYSWIITGFKYGDGMEVLAAFSPKAYALGKSAPLYKSDSELLTSDVTIEGVADVKFNVKSTSKAIDISGAKLQGSYYIGFERLKAGNYTLKLEGGVESERKSKAFAISENKFTFTWSNNGSHVYNKQSGTITLTITTDKPLDGFDTFIENFFSFTMTGSGGEVALAQSSGNQSVVVTFTSGVNVDTYTAKASENTNAEAKKFRETYKSSCSYPNLPQLRTWTIKERKLTFTLEPTLNSQPYTYNAQHQGLTNIRVNGADGDSGLLSGDSVTASWIVVRSGDTDVFRSGTAKTTTSSTNNVLGLNSVNHGTYTATVRLSNNTNYTAAEAIISWVINKYKLTFSDLAGGEKIYDGTAVTPTLKVNGDEITNGQYAPLGETINIVYSIKEGSTNHDSLVNAGTYEISVAGNTAITSTSVRDNMNIAQNYEVSGSLRANYTIKPRQIKLTWETTPSFVFNDKEQGLCVVGVVGINGTGQLAVQNSTSTINGVQLTGYAGKDTIVLSISGAIKNVNDLKAHMTAVISNVTGKNADNVSSSVKKNYEIVDNTNESGEFEITPSKLKIVYASGTTSKVYDATTTVNDNNFAFTVSSTNGGANGNVNMFAITKTYDDKNVSNGYTKTVTFVYSFVSTDANYALAESAQTTQAVPNVGQITPAHIKVALNKLRSGKATRTFTNDVWYGGVNGASGNGNSRVYRSGEGFTVSGVLSSDVINVVAQYREADDSRNGTGTSFDLSSYVNDVVKNADGTFVKAAAGSYFKTLVFTMTGDDAKNYTFNVYNSNADGNKYSNNDSTAGDTQTVTVYDFRDKASGHQNASGAEQIQIEITVKSVRVEYSNTAQSYANDDNTYNKDWLRVTGTNRDMQGAGADIVVTNGWMYQDGKDRPADSTDPKREYHGYTTIRGNATSQLLGAAVSKKDGMDLNYRLSNQPTLTIAYFVDNTGTYEIDTLARLLIASFYYTAHQNPGDQIFMQIVQSGYKWFEVVKGEDYSQVEFAVPENSPINIDETIDSWDAYINALNEAGYAVFYNETEKAWGCYVSDSSQSTSLPNSYKLTKDISGKFTADDIKVLDAFFTVTTTDDNGQSTTTRYTWNGANSDYLQNVLSASVDKVATVNGSLFVSTKKADGETSPTGFDGTFDGNGYVIEYLNIMGYGKDNVGLFDIIGANGIVKNLHLRNVTINANQGNVGGIAGSIAAAEGDADAAKNVTNVSFHGKITASGGNVGGLFGTSARAIHGAIVLGEISASGANVGGVVGVVGTATADLTNVVSMMQITASGGTVGAFTSNNANVGKNCTHMTNAVWQRVTSGTGFVNFDGKNVNYNALMSGSNSLYANAASASGTYDVISKTFADSGQNVNPRQSKRLRDMVYVYLLMYSLSANGDKYTISSSSWLVGTADGTTANPIAIANKQNVSLLRELRFAAFVLKANVSIDIASTFSGAFYGSVTSAVNESGASYGYKITCNKPMFEVYATVPTAWLVTPTQP